VLFRSDTLLWNDAGVEGASRFLKRLWSFAYENRAFFGHGNLPISIDWPGAPEEFKRSRREIHLALNQANFDFAKFQFNTVVSAAMKILNALERTAPMTKVVAGAQVQPAYQVLINEGLSILLRLLAPFTPHIAHSLWRDLGCGEDILTAPWPESDAQALVADEIELVLQVNGKLRGNMRVAKDLDRVQIEKLAMQNANVQKHVGGQPVKKVVVVPGRLVNVVV
jgi:leucyl-tRNA synthetase